MSPVLSIHEYDLAPGVSPDRFAETAREAAADGLFDLPGLCEYRFLRGIKGDREGAFTAVWEYESREAWEALWGSPDDPVGPEEYPDRWREWESRLDPLLASDPDDVAFTSYEVLSDRQGGS